MADMETLVGRPLVQASDPELLGEPPDGVQALRPPKFANKTFSLYLSQWTRQAVVPPRGGADGFPNAFFAAFRVGLLVGCQGRAA
jgi:hypothetical protein